MDKLANILAALILATLSVCVILGLMLLCSLPVMLLWNWIIPTVSRGSLLPLTWAQSLGLICLCRLLFGQWGLSKKG